MLRIIVNHLKFKGDWLVNTGIDDLLDKTSSQWERLKELFYHIQNDRYLNEGQKQILFEHLYNDIKNYKFVDGYKSKIKGHLVKIYNIMLEPDEYDLKKPEQISNNTSKIKSQKIVNQIPGMMEQFDEIFNE